MKHYLRAALGAAAMIFFCAFTPQYGGQHDFDFEFGSWKASLDRLAAPLSGSKTWNHYEGTSVVHSLLGGREDVGELQVSGPAGNINGITIRTFDAKARHWDIHWVNAANGVMTNPMQGGFSNGRGLFYANDTYNGKPIQVRFLFFDLTRDAFRFEQSFSGDGGRTWEVNWKATFTRM